MYKIVRKKALNPTVTQMEIEAPLVAKKAKPGQFIILRVDEEGERIPLTVAGTNPEEGTVKIIFQIVGGTTEKLNHKDKKNDTLNNNYDIIRHFWNSEQRIARCSGTFDRSCTGSVGNVACRVNFPSFIQSAERRSLRMWYSYQRKLNDKIQRRILFVCNPFFNVRC